MNINNTGFTDVYYQSFKDEAIQTIKSGMSILVMDDNVLGLEDGTFYKVYSDGSLELVHKGIYELDGFVIGVDSLICGIDDLVNCMLGMHNDGRAESCISFKKFDSVADRDQWALDLVFSIKNGLQYIVSEGEVK